MPNQRDVQFGEIAVAKEYATREQVNECVEILARFEGTGVPHTLKRIMIEKRILTQGQADKAAEEAYGDALVGEIIGNCTIHEKLGQGGMGIVYKAEHCSLHRTSAFKILDPLVARRDEQLRKRFIREAQLAAQLNHPNVVTVHNADVEGDYCFIEMEYVEGRDLSESVKAQGRFSVQKAIDVIHQAAKGLAAGHNHPQKIIHRDVKPQNILIASDDTVKVADFGLAKAADSQPSDISVLGAVMGTVHYMSPEQCLGEETDHRTDIYSLGAAFYYVITGRLPYESSSFAKLRNQHIEGKLTPPKQHNPNIPDDVGQVIVKMMAKSPSDRYYTMDGVIAALENIKKGIADLGATILDEPDEREVGEAETMPDASLRLPPVRKLVFVSLACALTVLLFATALTYFRKSDQKTDQQPAPVEEGAKKEASTTEEEKKIILGTFDIPDNVRDGKALRREVIKKIEEKPLRVTLVTDVQLAKGEEFSENFLGAVTVTYNEDKPDKPITVDILRANGSHSRYPFPRDVTADIIVQWMLYRIFGTEVKE